MVYRAGSDDQISTTPVHGCVRGTTVEITKGDTGVETMVHVGYCPHPVTVYIGGHIKGYI